MSVELIPAAMVHAELLAGMHRICFAKPWDTAAMVGLLDMPGSDGRIAVAGGRMAPSGGGEGPAGLVLWRVVADEAEILTLAVLPPWRRTGLGRTLMRAAMDQARQAGAAVMFLEVASGNDAALALYQGLGFQRMGVRRGYYDGADALTMRADLGVPE
ncbi:MAG: GNAT family N-acetyltransferase [Actinomycetota bacterium]